MVTKQWMQFYAGMKAAEIAEMVALLSRMKGRDQRDAAEEALLQDHINALPDPPGLMDVAELYVSPGLGDYAGQLKQARERLRNGCCASCGLQKEEIAA
ncbi:hypothetical protein GGR90_002759 [Sphingopyxis italica]|uniref:Uncharacterized protein n=1 Tax=Sphingopyxis italica TaxID=1129133 RepID=A0A7X5XSL4_9SPHN|nr:hypothetical protein [Sphingopyxis italica]NJB90565.1 hypothetical protein [Sphingopyxis italica]